MAQDLFLGIDLGTGGVRACAIDADAKIVGIATAALLIDLLYPLFDPRVRYR
jgi:sugar (pentulose or hexulose) kinase